MTNHLAIGGVSLTLKALLEDRMEFARLSLPASDKVTMTISAPDVAHQNISGPRVNLFLYHISENASLKNQEIPGHGHPAAFGHPPLSLNLSYLITAYGLTDQNDVLAQQVLGDAMRVFHDFPIITDSMLRERSPSPPPPATKPTMLEPDLLGQFERIKITLQQLGIEEISKIWGTMGEASLRCAVGYEVSVVQIESLRPRRVTLPVRERRVVVFPLLSPQITEVINDSPVESLRLPVAATGETVRIRGVNLGGPTKRVTLGGFDMIIISQRDDEIIAEVPATVPAGAHPVQVVQDLILGVTPGQPIEKHPGMRSNTVAMLVIPGIVTVLPPAAGAGDTVSVTVVPAVQASQQVEILLGDRIIPARLFPDNAASSSTVRFELPAAPDEIPAGSPLMRVRIDGAESRLVFDSATNQYNEPRYTIT